MVIPHLLNLTSNSIQFIAIFPLQCSRGRFSDGSDFALKLFGSAHRADRIEELLEALRSKHFVLNTMHLNACMAAFIRCKKPGKAMKIFREITHPDSYSHGSALQALSKMGHVNEALELFHTIEEKGSVHYNTVMSCLSKKVNGGNLWTFISTCARAG